MPIKFKCNCGHVLSVSSKLAGKTGKCPKCSKALKVPVPKQPAGVQANSAAPSKEGAAKATPAKAAQAVAATSVGNASLDSLFEDAGLVQKSGPTCPQCLKDIRPGTVVCTACGFNFETGEKLLGFDAQSQAAEFDNQYLQEASENMKRDLVMDSRRDKAAMPWWVIMSFLIGVVTLCAAGVIIVDGKFGTPEPESTFFGKIQRWPVFTTLGLTVGITGIAISVFAHMSICYFGFTRSIGQGFACFFLPMIYSLVYGIMNWADNKAAVKAIILAAVFLGLGAFLIVRGGGFGLITAAFG